MKKLVLIITIFFLFLSHYFFEKRFQEPGFTLSPRSENSTKKLIIHEISRSGDHHGLNYWRNYVFDDDFLKEHLKTKIKIPEGIDPYMAENTYFEFLKWAFREIYKNLNDNSRDDYWIEVKVFRTKEDKIGFQIKSSNPGKIDSLDKFTRKREKKYDEHKPHNQGLAIYFLTKIARANKDIVLKIKSGDRSLIVSNKKLSFHDHQETKRVEYTVEYIPSSEKRPKRYKIKLTSA
jgi:hypothetical protein